MVMLVHKLGPATFWLGAIIYCCCCCCGSRADDRKTPSELIRSRGFNADEFDVISQNYVLKVYRIINPLADTRTLHKIPVIAAHGISFDMTSMMSSSGKARPRRPRVDEQVTLYAPENGTDDRGLHFYLSNNNYDVWLLDARGVSSRTQRRLSDEDQSSYKRFWDFSLDEQALIDLPSQIEFVLKETGAPKASFIGYSQSTSLMFALLSMRPEFSDKLAAFVALAPVVFTSSLKGVAYPLAFTRYFLQPFSSLPTVPEWYRRSINWLLTYACSISYIKSSLCRYLWRGFAGKEKADHLEGATTENVLKATSFKSVEQFVNNGLLKDFRMYDYRDELRNIEEYGQPVPPQYNVSKITFTGISLFRGTNDFMSNAEDQMRLLARLRVPLFEDHILEDYAHLDFIISPTVTMDINEPILRILDKLSNRTVVRVSHTLGRLNPRVQGAQLVPEFAKDKSPADRSG